MKYKSKSKIVLAATLIITFILVIGATAIGAYAATQILINEDNHSDINRNTNDSAETYVGTTQKSSGSLPSNIQKLDFSLDINGGGVSIVPVSSNEIVADYDEKYYDVKITEKHGKWVISVSGKIDLMGPNFVQLHIPNIRYTMDVSVLNGSFSYNLTENNSDTLKISAKSSSLDFTSKNQYSNSSIFLTAKDKEFLKYGLISYPDYFTKIDNGFQYKNGTGANKIDITLTGYTNVDFAEKSK